MSVRNPLKAGIAVRVIVRKCAVPPPVGLNPAPLPGSRRLKPTYQKPRRKTPNMLLKGRAHRPHIPNQASAGPRPPNGTHFAAGHLHSEAFTRLVPLTKAYKKNK